MDNQFTLIMPCAGMSSRYPGVRPKWMLTTPDGQLALQKAYQSVPSETIKRVVIGIRKEHATNFNALSVIAKAIPEAEIVVLERDTNGPAETVQQLIANARIEGPIAIKDADSFFQSPPPPKGSFVAMIDLRQHLEVSRVGAKSFVAINEQGFVVQIVEKNVCSNFVSAGLYGVSDARLFNDMFSRIQLAKQSHGEIFVSHVLSEAINNSEIVQPFLVDKMIDVGTLIDWNEYTEKFCTIIVDIDGVIVRNQSHFFPPYWGDQPIPLSQNIEHLRNLQSRGAQLIFVTSRPERFRAHTAEFLSGFGLNAHALVMDCRHGRRYLVNDFTNSNPYPSAVAVNLPRNSDELSKLLLNI